MKCKIILIFFITVFLISCSTKPKDTGEINVLRRQAEIALEAGNKEAGRGNLEAALTLITESKRKGIITDDLYLIIRCSLSRGNVLFLLDRIDEAFNEWESAAAEAQKLGDGEIISAAKIYRARGNLLSGRASPQSVLDEVSREQANIKTNRQYIAFAWQVRGLALRALGNFREAEESVRKSLEIHERDRYLENASFDWYTIASIRSLAGNPQGAITALENSIAIDRRIENSHGLAASYRDMGDVYTKMGRAREAAAAYERSRAIFDALGIKD